MGNYKKNSLTLTSTVGLGVGVMTGAGLFALLGQVAGMAGTLFPVIFIIGAIVTGFSAYSPILRWLTPTPQQAELVCCL